MYDYMCGSITNIFDNFVILRVNDIGYKVYIPNIKKINNKKITLYTYLYSNDAVKLLFGFTERIEKEIFIRLIQIKNIGVKSAFNILKKCNYKLLIDSVFTLDKTFLLTLPKINNNNVDLLIKKLQTLDVLDKENINNEFLNALRIMEYNDILIYEVYKKIDKNLPVSEQIRDAINLLEGNK